MADLRVELTESFLEVARLSGVFMKPEQLRMEVLEAPHRRPARLSSGWQVVYAFLLDSCCLKVGKAGPRTAARFTSQHYHPGRGSPDRRIEIDQLNDEAVGAWIEARATRLHFFLDERLGVFPLCLLEAFIQCRLTPLFEGKSLEG